MSTKSIKDTGKGYNQWFGKRLRKTLTKNGDYENPHETTWNPEEWSKGITHKTNLLVSLFLSTISFHECMQKGSTNKGVNGKHHDPISVKSVWCSDQVHYHGYHTPK